MATISEIPRWPGYETVQFRMNITDTKDNQILGRYNASAENSTIEIDASLPDSIINPCATLKVSASAVSEQYGEGEATEESNELYKSKLIAFKNHNLLSSWYIFPSTLSSLRVVCCVYIHTSLIINPSLSVIAWGF